MKLLLLLILLFSIEGARGVFVNVSLTNAYYKSVLWLDDMNVGDIHKVCADDGTLEMFVTLNPYIPDFWIYDSGDISETDTPGTM